MSLLDDIQTDSLAVETEMTAETERLLTDARQAIEATGTCDAVVAALVGTVMHHYFPTWQNDLQKQEIFAQINADLEAHNAAAASLVFTGTFYENTPADQTRALFAIVHLPDSSSIHIHPYESTKAGISWEAPMHEPIETPLLVVLPDRD